MDRGTEEFVVRVTEEQKASMAETAQALGVSIDDLIQMVVADIGTAPGASAWQALFDRFISSANAAIRSVDETVEGARQSRIRMAELERARR